MPFNIKGFKNSIKNNGIVPTSTFNVNMGIPPILRGTSLNNSGSLVPVNDVNKLITFRASDFKAPGITLLTDEVQRYGIGISQKMPYNAGFTDNVITFVSDRYGDLWQYFYQWIRGIFGFAGLDNIKNGATNFYNSEATYTMEYKQNYSVTISVTIYDQSGYEVQIINLYNAYPISMNDTQLSWDDKEGLYKITLGINFRDFSVQGASVSRPSANSSTSIIPRNLNNASSNKIKLN